MTKPASEPVKKNNMDPEIKKRWVSALRSGEYDQNKHSLRSEEGGYCCLGVLCDIVKDDVGGQWNGRSSSLVTSMEFYEKASGQSSHESLPTFVQNYAGLDGENPEVPSSDFDFVSEDMVSLAELNDGFDGENASFDQIADVIEKHF